MDKQQLVREVHDFIADIKAEVAKGNISPKRGAWFAKIFKEALTAETQDMFPVSH
jgi:hypothetical protein